jgi:Fe-S cluster assembly protein SufD
MTVQVSNVGIAAPSSKQAQREAYLQGLMTTVQTAVPESLALPKLRERAISIAKEHTFPSSKDEDWRFTDLSPMLEIPFQSAPVPATVDPAPLVGREIPEAIARLVLVNGHFSTELSDLTHLPAGLTVGSLAYLNAEASGLNISSRLAQSSGSHDLFTALNTAGFPDGAVVWVGRNHVIDPPIHILYLTQGTNAPLVSPRCLVVAESGSALTLVEDFLGLPDAAALTNSVTEIWADANAQVTHVRLQQEGLGTFHIGKTAITQAQDSRYTTISLTEGARVSRHNLEVYQTGAQTATNLYGLSEIAHSQLADTHSLIALSHPHGTAEQLHKCIVDDAAHGVFNGKIWVPRTAQLTNASQLNRTLLLSSKARVDAKPELDIVADNVKCAHGATVSQLDANEIFYLQSRGVSADAAQRLLISGFAMDIIARLPIASLKERLAYSVTQRSRQS